MDKALSKMHTMKGPPFLDYEQFVQQMSSCFATLQAIRCTISSCRCDCFQPGKTLVRTCDTCKHGWVAHALDKLGFRSMYQMGMQVEIVQPSVVFDIASLMLYGSQATPIRLKILLDRLFSVLQHEEVLQVLHGFGWSYEDYARGYILQEPSGRVLDKWNLCTREEEQVILQQFLRFGETKAIAQEIILRDAREQQERHLTGNPKTESEIKKFLERSNEKTGSSGAASPPLKPIEMRYPIRPFPGFGLPAKMLSPSLMPTYAASPASMPSAKKELKESPAKGHIGLSNSSPLAGSPLSRLQTMQPFDCRRNLNQLMSPTSSEKSQAATPHGSASPQNLSVSSSSSHPSPHHPLNKETSSKSSNIAQPSPGNGIKPAPTVQDYIPKDHSGALDFSQKDGISASTAAAIAATISNRSSMMMASYEEQRARANMNRNKPVPSVQRRNYSPTPGYGGTLVSPSGKKRVLCTACNKTFCDKGALKIHYSAVHLKEMHKCSVEGCNMMFSSRRSRNRHSANPNPKLHMPQNRRKLPDGAICLGDDKSPLCDGSLPNLQTPPTSISAALGMTPIEIKPIPVMPLLSDMAAQQRHLAETFGFALPHPGLASHIGELEPGEKRKLGLDFDKFGDQSSSRSASKKRKSVVPTRIAQMEDIYAMSDDNSIDGVVVTSDMDDDPMLGSVKSQTTDDVMSHGEDDVELEADIDPLSPQHSDSGLEPGELPMPNLVGDTEKSAFDERRERGIMDMRNLASNHQKEASENQASANSKPLGLDGIYEEALDFTTSKSESSEKKGDDPITSETPTYMDQSKEDERTVESTHDKEYDNHLSSDNEADFDTDGELSDVNIPLDAEDPKKCSACGKVFQNHFSVKTHYQNVHLKLMHTCSVEGCNAAFPSKRSRDRHSSNLNLHRKLLSTTEQNDGVIGPKTSAMNQSLRDEFLSRIYEPHHLSGAYALQEDNMTSSNDELRHSASNERSDVNHVNESVDQENKNSVTTTNGESPVSKTTPITQNGHHSANDTEDYNHSGSELDRSIDEENNEKDYLFKHTTNGESVFPVPEDSPLPDPHGDAECHVCGLRFRDNLVLKEHFEKIHPKEMYHCTIQGCDKIFSTRKSRNRHSQNENLHRHLSPTQPVVGRV